MFVLELRFHELVLKDYTLKEEGRLTIVGIPTMTLHPKMQLSPNTMRLLKEKEKN